MITDIRDIGGYGLNLLISEFCNLKCPYCFQKTHPYKFMKFKTFKSILDSTDENCNKNIIFFGGEPTLNKDFIDMAKYAKYNKWKIKINTNASSTYNIHKWGKYFDSIVISIEPTIKLTKKIRKIDKFELLMNDIKNFKIENPNVLISFSMVMTDLVQVEDVKQMVRLRKHLLNHGIYVNILENLGDNNNWTDNLQWWFFVNEMKEQDIEMYKEYIGYDESFADGFLNPGNQYLYNLDGAYLTFDTNGNIIPFDMNFDDKIGTFKDNYTDTINKIINNDYISNCKNCMIQNKEHCSLHPGVFKNLKKETQELLCERQRMMYMMKKELLENREPLYGYQE